MNNNGSDPSKFTPLVWFLMGSGASLLLILGAWGLWFMRGGNESLASVNVSLTSSEDEAQVANQLRGYWELTTINSDHIAISPQGVLFRQAEAKNTMGAFMRQQQAHRLENGVFARDFEELRLGLPSETENYTYTVETGQDYTKVRAIPVGDNQNFILAYTGAVFVTPNRQTRAQACQTAEPSGTAPGVSFIDGEVQCDGTAVPMR